MILAVEQEFPKLTPTSCHASSIATATAKSLYRQEAQRLYPNGPRHGNIYEKFGESKVNAFRAHAVM
jgi:hypothetical protein